MVHADSSTFNSGVSKSQAYEQVLEQARALFDGQRNWICNTANTASLLWHAYHALPTPSNQVNWAGFYILDPSVPSKAKSPVRRSNSVEAYAAQRHRVARPNSYRMSSYSLAILPAIANRRVRSSCRS